MIDHKSLPHGTVDIVCGHLNMNHSEKISYSLSVSLQNATEDIFMYMKKYAHYFLSLFQISSSHTLALLGLPTLSVPFRSLLSQYPHDLMCCSYNSSMFDDRVSSL